MNTINLAFIDTDREGYDRRAVTRSPKFVEGEFFVGDYTDEDVGAAGEFAIKLYRFVDAKKLSPQIQFFGDGFEAVRELIRRLENSGTELLAEVASRDEFSRRLLTLGLEDRSSEKLLSLNKAGA